ncbi:MAG: LysE family translocator [Rhodospirillaceae bacterium]
MFDYSLLHWTTFFSAAFLLCLSPGPDIAYIIGNTLKGGTRSGVAAMFGVWIGASVHVVMAAVGLSAILMTSATAFTIVKWVGAAYLIWLGIQAFRSSGGGLVPDQPTTSAPRFATILGQGVLVCVLNPKVAIFFLAFLPQFVVPGAGPTWAQLLLHGVLIIGIAVLVEPPLIFAANKIASATKKNAAITKWMDRTLGSLFILLGVRLALQER